MTYGTGYYGDGTPAFSSTFGGIVDRAFRKIGVKAEDEALTADQIALGVRTLNDLMFGLELWGVNLGHVYTAAPAPFPLDLKFHEGFVYLLAERLSTDYSVPPSFSADDFLRRIQAAYMVIPEAAMPKALLWTPSQRRTDIV